MPNKIIVIFKSIGRYWFTLLIITIIIVVFYHQQAALIITIITIILFIISFIPALYSKQRLLRTMKKYNKIEDVNIAKKLGKDVKTIKNKMFSLSQNQEKKKWVIVFFNKNYIFYGFKVITKLIELHEKSSGESQILEGLKDFDVKSKEEIKAITENLIKSGKINSN